ncbi:MAG: hydrogenase 3 maturation endopeptidase HyCI [Candidatus Bathyarchaeia archaeon]|jgi:hydrogenase 3 maturation protease
MANEIKKELENWFSSAKRIVLAGIGNPIRTDDYLGLKIIEQLKSKLPATVLLLEAETVPESYLLDIEEFKPTHVLLIDAASLGLHPGEAILVDAEQIADYPAITTHLLPLNIFCEYVRQTTGAKIALLLVEPKSMEFGEGLTLEVQAAAERLTKILAELLG